MDIFDVYNFQRRVENAKKKGNLRESLELLGIAYFEGSLEGSNKNTAIFEFSRTGTMAIEVRLMEKKIRFWGWIGGLKGDYFWKYVFENYKELWYRVLSLLIAEYFSPIKCISCEIVSNVNSNLLCQWEEVTKENIESLKNE